MTENSKPEWIEIAENDGPIAPPKASKTLPLVAVFAAALILGIGTVVGQVQEVAPANAVEAASVQSIVSTNTTTSAPVTRITNPAVNTEVIATTYLQNPDITQLPTQNETDDEENYDEGDDD